MKYLLNEKKKEYIFLKISFQTFCIFDEEKQNKTNA